MNDSDNRLSVYTEIQRDVLSFSVSYILHDGNSLITLKQVKGKREIHDDSLYTNKWKLNEISGRR